MRLKALASALLVLTLAACSSQPREPSGNAPAAGGAPPPAANVAAPTRTAASDKLEAPAVLNRSLVSAGYKATSIKGEIYYCRMVDVTGTQFKRRVCLNEAQVRDEERKSKEMADRMIDSGFNPGCATFPNCD